MKGLEAARFGMAVLAVVAMAGVGFGARAQGNDLPDGPGKAELLQACTSCHDTGIIVAKHRTAEQWTGVITQMVDMGAMVSDDQTKAIVAYLSAHYGSTDTSQPAPAPSAAPLAPGNTPPPTTPPVNP